ncbi:hypothetical protein BC938DRAFT_478216, partial [Jimgerdemannia flammicorona]
MTKATKDYIHLHAFHVARDLNTEEQLHYGFGDRYCPQINSELRDVEGRARCRYLNMLVHLWWPRQISMENSLRFIRKGIPRMNRKHKFCKIKMPKDKPAIFVRPPVFWFP